MAAQTSGVANERHEPHRPRTNWTRLRDIPLAILAWILVIAVVLWAASHVIGTLLVLAIAGLLAFALYPIINWLSRGMPRPLAMALVYVVFFALIGLLVYFIVDTAVQQLVTVAGRLEQLVKTGPHAQTSPLYDFAHQLGLSDQQLQQISGFLVEQAQGIAGGILPILSGIANLVINLVVVTVLSIYLIPNGPRVNHWLRTGVPLSFRARASFLMDTLDRVVGGYIRGQFTLATLIGVLVGIGMFIFQVPFAILLGVMAFVLEFIPFLGVIISGAACVLIALTQGWLTALLVLGWFVVMHIIEGDVVGPRIVGSAVGLHPAISLVALIAGAELFGLWGALFAAPLAGLLQALIVALWQNWRTEHPEQFPTGHTIEHDVAVVPVVSETPKSITVPVPLASDDPQPPDASEPTPDLAPGAVADC
jgi:predicted PurR-regulated permease PerM